MTLRLATATEINEPIRVDPIALAELALHAAKAAQKLADAEARLCERNAQHALDVARTWAQRRVTAQTEASAASDRVDAAIAHLAALREGA